MEFENHGGIGMGPSYDSLRNSNSTSPRMPVTPGSGEVEVMEAPLQMMMPRYRECQKNHAVSLGGLAVDGCGEFMPAGQDGTMDALKCAACNCHRNFHRKETHPGAAAVAAFAHHLSQQYHYYHRSPSGYLHHLAPRQQQPLALPSPSPAIGGYREETEDIGFSNPNVSSGSKKRVRTKFTLEQKENMRELAERLEWRIQKQDEVVVEQFCNEYGVKKQVFKVWMHNNKHINTKKP